MEKLIMMIMEKIALAKDPEEQRELLRLVLDEYEISEKTRALAVNSDMSEYMSLYLATRRLDGLSEETLKNYRYVLRNFAVWTPLNIEQVTTMDIRRYLSEYEKNTGTKKSSLNTIQTVIKSFFSWLEDEEYIVKSPAKKLKEMKTEKRTRKSLTVEQLELVRSDGCKTLRDRALIEFLFSTGARVSEVSQIDIRNINWSDNSVSVIGKGDKERTIYFSEKCKTYLRKYLKSRRSLECNALFITSIKPYRRMSGRSIQAVLSEIGERADIGISLYPHLMRHTMATLGYASGIDINIIKELLGHSSVATTEIYTRTSSRDIMYSHKKHMGI